MTDLADRRAGRIARMAAGAAALAAAAAGGAWSFPAAPVAQTTVASPSSGCGGEAPALTREQRTITVGGETRGYLLDAPAMAPNRPLPLVFGFHGFQASGAQQRDGTGLGELATKERFIAVHPDGHEGVRLLDTVGRGWELGVHETRDFEVVRAILDALERERCVDRRRIYATGMSLGGLFANLVGCRMADRVAAIAPVAGAMALPGCAPAAPVAVLIIYGRADNVFPPTLPRAARDWWARVHGCEDSADRDGCTAYDGCKADLVYCEGSHAHLWPADATDRIWRFFAAHPKPSLP